MNDFSVESTQTPVSAPAPEQFASGMTAADDWRASLPESWADKLRDVADPDEAAEALERGLAYHPATRAEDIRLELPKDFSGHVDRDVQQHFRELCVQEGITPAQAQALVDWQIGAERQMRERLVEEGAAQLRRSWGARFEQNRSEALRAFSALDRRMGGALSSSPAGRSMANDPSFVRAFYEIGRLLSEDSLSAGITPAAGMMRETAEETYNGMFRGE